MEKQREGFVKETEAMYEEVMKWREEHPKASMDEIVKKVTVERRKVMGGLVEKVALAQGTGAEALEVACQGCGEEMENKGENQRSVIHEEGESSRQSYRAGLWDAATFANQQWVEAEKRGVSFAKRLACVADGAAWIWQIVFMCFAPCFQILDWWHATQYLWMIGNAAFSDPKEAAAWVEQQKFLLYTSQLAQFFVA